MTRHEGDSALSRRRRTDTGWRPHPRAGRNPLYHLLAKTLRSLFHFYGRWRVLGLEHVPVAGAVLIAANHASYVDPALLGAALYGRRRVWMMGKSELWRNRLVARVLDLCMAFPVHRNTPDRTALRCALQWLADGEAVSVFPEGERTRDGHLRPAEHGLALLVQKSGAPVVPVALIGTFAMMPAHRRSIRRVPLTVAFGPPIVFAPRVTREEISACVMCAIASLIEEHACPASTAERRP